jgi:dTDP-glucose pyrophosphorylase
VRELADLDAYVCTPDMSVHEALGRLNSTEHLFQVVIDRDSQTCVGTLTDGDIRRALLDGMSLQAPVGECMFTAFSTGREDDPDGNQRMLDDPARLLRFLPVLDGAGKLTRILIKSAGDGSGFTALVMAGGFGTRLGERTRNTPKPLLEVGGQPILEYVMAQLELAGATRIYISLHFLGDKVRAFVAERQCRAEVQFIEEEEPLGTAGALALLPLPIHGPLVVVNGDVITQADLPALRQFHVRHKLEATIGVTPYEVDVPFGVVRMGEDGLLAGIEEKPKITEFVAAGVYCLEPTLLSLVRRGSRLDMPELLHRAIELGQRVGAFPIHEYWVDVGRESDLLRAHKDMS